MVSIYDERGNIWEFKGLTRGKCEECQNFERYKDGTGGYCGIHDETMLFPIKPTICGTFRKKEDLS
jgi:hypothetical protein